MMLYTKGRLKIVKFFSWYIKFNVIIQFYKLPRKVTTFFSNIQTFAKKSFNMPTTFPPCLLRYHSEGGAKRYRALAAKNSEGRPKEERSVIVPLWLRTPKEDRRNSEGGAKRYRALAAKNSKGGAISLSLFLRKYYKQKRSAP